MAGGRPTKPLQQKILEGARVRTDKGDTHGADVPLELPPPPVWLNKSAKKHWDQLGAQLLAVGLISSIDGDVFALHCSNIAKYGEVELKLDDIEKWTQSTPNGFVMQSALLQIRNRLQELIVKTAREFGMTPASRSAMKIQKPEQGDLFGDNDFTPYS